MEKFQTNGLPGRTLLTQQGKEYLWFGGTDYLGMSYHDHFIELLKEGLDIYGSHYGSSRNGPVAPVIYQDAENALASFVGAPCSLTVSSGIWAGQLVTKVIETALRLYYNAPDAPIQNHVAPKTHPALWDVKPLHNDIEWENWVNRVSMAVSDSEANTIHILYFDSVGSPWVNLPDLQLLKNVAKEGKNVWIIADDSHGLGVTGQNGGGVYRELADLDGIKLIVCSSLNKALGVPGGVIFSESRVIEFIRSTPWFAGSSPIPPAYLYAMKQLMEFGEYDKALKVLKRNVLSLTDGSAEIRRFNYLSEYPVFCSMLQGLHEYLYSEEILVPCFSYPNADDAPVLRLVVNASHRPEDLDRLCLVLDRWRL